MQFCADRMLGKLDSLGYQTPKTECAAFIIDTTEKTCLRISYHRLLMKQKPVLSSPKICNCPWHVGTITVHEMIMALTETDNFISRTTRTKFNFIYR